MPRPRRRHRPRTASSTASSGSPTTRPVVAGDVLTATLTVDTLRQIGGSGHHRHPQRDHRRRRRAGRAPATRDARAPRRRRMSWTPGQRARRPQTYAVTRADLVALRRAPAATSTRSTGPTGSPRSVGLPGVIAHGMYTLALAARAVDDLGRRRRPGRRARLQVHQARSSCPTTTTGVDRRGRAARSRTSTTGWPRSRSTVTCGGAKVLGMPKAVVRCLTLG